MSVQQKFWKETNKVTILEKLRRTITLPAFCVRCGEDNGSLAFTARDITNNFLFSSIGAAYDLKNAFTIEFWHKPLGPGNYTLFRHIFTVNSNYNIDISMDSGKYVVNLKKGGAISTSISSFSSPINSWVHLALVYNGANCILYINGELDSGFNIALAANLDAAPGNDYTNSLGLGANPYFGYLAEFRIWNFARNQSEIQYRMNKRCGKNSGLLLYYRLNESTSPLHEWLSGTSYAITLYPTSGLRLVSTEYPPLRYGASFIAAKFPITLDGRISLKYPINKPSNANFMLCVSWVDDDDIVNRYRLWDIDGVVIYPYLPDRYKGQKITNDFVFEIWNVDGNEDCDLESDLLIKTSNVTLPQLQNDVAESDYFTSPVIDYSLAQTWATAFPLTFDTTQFGTCAAPVAQTANANYSTNLTNYGAIQQ